MDLSYTERRVAAHPGVPAHQVAELIDTSLDDVIATRRRLGRDPQDGQPGARRTESPSFETIDRLMRDNRAAGL